MEQLLAGALDVLLLALPLEQPGLIALVLYDEPFLLAVPEAHPLASSRNCDVAALAGERLVLLEEGHCLRDQALAVCDQAGLAPSSAHECGSALQRFLSWWQEFGGEGAKEVG